MLFNLKKRKPHKYVYFGNQIPESFIDKWEYDDKNPEYVFSFGGDGTMLGAIHMYEHLGDKCKFVGIKKGRLGFFYGFESDDLDYVVNAIEEENKNIIKNNYYNLLSYTLIGDESITGYAINEIALTNPIHTQIIDVYINDKLFEEFRGTGFIACPPSGSTAYSKSIGGSVIDPLLEAFELVEIASINNSIYKTLTSPMIFSKYYEVRLVLKSNENIYISVDGKEIRCQNIREVLIRLSNKKINIISADNFYEKVKKAFLGENNEKK